MRVKIHAQSAADKGKVSNIAWYGASELKDFVSNWVRARLGSVKTMVTIAVGRLKRLRMRFAPVNGGSPGC